MKLYKKKVTSDGSFVGFQIMNGSDLRNFYDSILTLWKNNLPYGTVSTTTSGLGNYQTITLSDRYNTGYDRYAYYNPSGDGDYSRTFYVSIQQPPSYDTNKFPLLSSTGTSRFEKRSVLNQLFNEMIDRWKTGDTGYGGINWHSENYSNSEGAWASIPIYLDVRNNQYSDKRSQQYMWKRYDSVYLNNTIFYFCSSAKKFKALTQNDLMELTKHFVTKLWMRGTGTMFSSAYPYNSSHYKTTFVGEDYRSTVTQTQGWDYNDPGDSSYWIQGFSHRTQWDTYTPYEGFYRKDWYQITYVNVRRGWSWVAQRYDHAGHSDHDQSTWYRWYVNNWAAHYNTHYVNTVISYL